MPRSSKTATKIAREYLVRTADKRDYARDPNLEMCQHAANGLGAGAHVVALDEQLIPFGEPVYTVPDSGDIVPDEDGLEPEQVGSYGEDDVEGSEDPQPELSPQAAKVVRNVKRIKAGKAPVEDEDTPVDLVFPGGCACGCGEAVAPKRQFRQGHDQRLIGKLAAASSVGKQIRWTSAEAGELVGDAMAYGARVFSDFGMAKLARACGVATTAAHGPVPPTPEQQTDDSLNTPVAADSYTAALVPGDEIKVKIGRHERFARIHGMNQAGKVTAVRYTTVKEPTKETITEKFIIIGY